MTKPYDHDDDTDDDNDHKDDSYTVAGAAPGASVPCSCSFVPVPLFWFLCSSSFVPSLWADVRDFWALSSLGFSGSKTRRTNEFYINNKICK